MQVWKLLVWNHELVIAMPFSIQRYRICSCRLFLEWRCLWNVTSISRSCFFKKSDSFWGHVLFFGLLWLHSVLSGNFFLQWNPINTLSSWHHPRLVRPQGVQVLGVAFPLGLPLGLLLLAWNDSYMASGIWLAPFFFRDGKKCWGTGSVSKMSNLSKRNLEAKRGW